MKWLSFVMIAGVLGLIVTAPEPTDPATQQELPLLPAVQPLLTEAQVERLLEIQNAFPGERLVGSVYPSPNDPDGIICWLEFQYATMAAVRFYRLEYELGWDAREVDRGGVGQPEMHGTWEQEITTRLRNASRVD
jgi:hypothetical protein